MRADHEVDPLARKARRRNLRQKLSLATVPLRHDARLVVAKTGIDNDALSAALDQQRVHAADELSLCRHEVRSQSVDSRKIFWRCFGQHDGCSHRRIFSLDDPGDGDVADFPALHDFRVSLLIWQMEPRRARPARVVNPATACATKGCSTP